MKVGVPGWPQVHTEIVLSLFVVQIIVVQKNLVSHSRL